MMRALLLATIGAFALFGNAYLQAPTESLPGPAWDDPGPRGHSRFVDTLSQARHVRILEASLVPDPDHGEDALIFLFPNHRDHAPDEVQAIYDLVTNGATIIVAADADGAKPWADLLRLGLHGFPLLNPREDATACVALRIHFDATPLPACLPSPTAFIDPRLDPEAATRSTQTTYESSSPLVLDLDQDGNQSLGDIGPKPFILAVEHDIGQGRVIALADGDLWRNQVLDEHPENAKMALALANLAPGHATIYIDATSGTRDRADAITHTHVRLYESGQGLPIIAAAGALVLATLAIPMTPRWRPHRSTICQEDPDTEDAIAQITRPTTQNPPTHEQP